MKATSLLRQLERFEIVNTPSDPATHSQCMNCKWAWHNFGGKSFGWCYMFRDYVPQCAQQQNIKKPAN
jgi:hypothetical protein